MKRIAYIATFYFFVIAMSLGCNQPTKPTNEEAKQQALNERQESCRAVWNYDCLPTVQDLRQAGYIVNDEDVICVPKQKEK